MKSNFLHRLIFFGLISSHVKPHDLRLRFIQFLYYSYVEEDSIMFRKISLSKILIILLHQLIISSEKVLIMNTEILDTYLENNRGYYIIGDVRNLGVSKGHAIQYVNQANLKKIIAWYLLFRRYMAGSFICSSDPKQKHCFFT